MKINSTGTLPIPPTAQRPGDASTTAAKDSGRSDASTRGAEDSVSLSHKAEDLRHRATQRVGSDAVRSEHLEAIRQAVEDGSYPIDGRRTTTRLVDLERFFSD